MKEQEELLKSFQTEELEKRFEMGWISRVKVGASYEGVSYEATFDIE
ncbi:hypothetical protein [Allomuricauda sp. SCSIO 65647]|nr:hypothetical protein [Muricauda sp. SCSIO 65647]UJH68198.1 hypothetical protein L0P89_03075 [Muricauda sp. SCSIO 65647]